MNKCSELNKMIRLTNNVDFARAFIWINNLYKDTKTTIYKENRFQNQL